MMAGRGQEFFVVRGYRDGVSSCGGPYTSRAEAQHTAGERTPDNGMAVRITQARRDPTPTAARPVLARMVFNPRSVVIVAGPFASNAAGELFLEAAFAPTYRLLARGWVPPLGARDDDWTITLDDTAAAPPAARR
jgi:hypothetical protein